MKFDLLQDNAYRLLGCTRDQAIEPYFLAGCERIDLPLPGLTSPERTPALLDQCRLELTSPERATIHWCSWFDGQRPLDALALREIRQQRWDKARALWQEDGELLSLHNRAVLELALALAAPQDAQLWKASLSSWCQLASGGHPGYAWIAQQLRHSLSAQARWAGQEHQPEELRRCLEILAVGSDLRALDEFERSLLEDDLSRLRLACADVRKELLDFQTHEVTLREAGVRLESRILPVAHFLRQACRPRGAVQEELGREMALIFRSLSRAWRDVPEMLPFHPEIGSDPSQGKRVQQRLALENALHWAPPELREELVPELHHLSELMRPNNAPQHEQSILARAKSRFSPLALLGVVLLALLAGIFAISPRPAPLRPARDAAKARIRVILEENRSNIEKIRRLEKEQPGSSELERLRKRNQELIRELRQLEKVE